LIKNLKKFGRNAELDYTVFASGDSRLPFKVESVENLPSSSDDQIMHYGKHIIFELALISKAFSMQNNFDLLSCEYRRWRYYSALYAFCKTPPLNYFASYLWRKLYPQVFFILPRPEKCFLRFHQQCPEEDFARIELCCHHSSRHWFAGIRFQPRWRKPPHLGWPFNTGKGPDIVIKVAEEIGQEALLFGIYKEDYQPWIESELLAKIYPQIPESHIKMRFGQPRASLIPFLQHSRLFLFPVQAEEAFGLVLIESLACGTPVVAFARGAVPEIVQDGISGYLVNPSEDDIRGNWAIRQTGFAGLCAAAERILFIAAGELSTDEAELPWFGRK